MSLLLDALKKAAEQKAAKTRDEKPGSGSGSPEETALDLSEGRAREDSADDDSIPRHQLEDETLLDPSELDTRLERLQKDSGDRTETGLDIADGTETRAPAQDRQAKSGEDETLIFAEDDVAEVTGRENAQPRRAADDETDLSRLAGDEEDVSQTGLGAGGDAPPSEDTELRIAEQPQDPTRARPPSGDDETDLSRLAVDEEDVSQTGLRAGGDASASEDTDLRQPDPTLARTVSSGDETDVSLPPRLADDLEAGEARQREVAGEETDLSASAMTAEQSSGEDDTGSSDEDLSLLLVEREPTQLTSPTSVTDPQRPQDASQALKAGAPGAEDLGLVDSTQNKLGEERTSTTDSTQTGSRSSDTSTTGRLAGPTRVRPDDATGTHTYAPDNYDRTLMRLPNDDASKLFAGMKSDSDVVMTPDYAKQVFRSKSSAQRVQHYKFYAGIAIVILLGIGVYGALEYQAESEIIDSSLRPLKNDPMPGIIRKESGEPKTEPLFTAPEVDERALEIIKNAEQDEPVSAEPDLSEESATAEQAGAEKPPVDEAAESEGAATEMAAARTAKPAEPETTETGPAEAEESADSQTSMSGVIADAQKPAPGSGASSNLKIQTASRLEEKQVLLREAYQAYRSGNDELALQRYNQVLEIDPGNRNALLARAAIQVQNGNSAAAIEDYQALLLANPKDSLAMASLIAVAKYSPRETETQLKLMIRDEPDSPYLNFALANAYGAQNRWQEAQGHYYRALQNNPDDPNYAYNLAVSLEHISQPAAAVSYYRRALENYNKGLATFSRDVVDRRLEKLAKP